MILGSVDNCADLALTQLPDDVRERFAQDPNATITNDLGLTVTPVTQLRDTRTDGGTCDGTTFLDDDVILYAETPGSRRENFTLAHEVGHWLIDHDDDIYSWLADQPEPGKMLETVCDLIAQRLLLHHNTISQLIGSGPLRATHIVELFNASAASRPVAAIALADHLPAAGAVAIIDRGTATVTTASIKPDPAHGWPRVFPWPGQRLRDTDPLLQLQAGQSTTRRGKWRTPWGAEGTFYLDACVDDRRVYLVLSTTDLWDAERFHTPQRQVFDTRPALTVTCCGQTTIRRGYPCDNCDEPYCPLCGLCRCQRREAKEQICSSCFLATAPHLLHDGVCADCRT